MTRSSAGAFIIGSAIRRPSGSLPSCAPRCRASPSACRRRSCISCRRCAVRICSNRRALPRRSIGRPYRIRSAYCSNIRTILRASRAPEPRSWLKVCARSCGPRSNLLPSPLAGRVGTGAAAARQLTRFLVTSQRPPPDALRASAPDQPGGKLSPASGRGEGVAGRLAENILYFARALRAAGIPLGPGAVIDALEAVKAADLGERQDFYWTLHAVFVKKHEHSVLFDQAFRLFFRKRGYFEKMAAMMLQPAPGPAQRPEAGSTRVQDALFAPLKDKLPEQEHLIEIDRRFTVSDREVLQRKDFAQMTAAEIARAKDAIRRMALSLEAVQVRRLAPDRRGHLVDMRRTLRASMKAGGALIDLKYRGPQTRQPPIVAL